jgi:hypothetical protein
MIQITRTGLVSNISLTELGVLRSHFQQHHFVRLREFVEAALLRVIHDRLETAEFTERNHELKELQYRESEMKDDNLRGTLLFLANDPALFEVVQQITTCGNLTCFRGRVYQKIPGRGHFDSWHNDLDPSRIVGMSINLSRDIYCGGSLKIRDAKSKELLEEVINTGIGDAILFRISPALEHVVEEVHGKARKVAFAGWFLSGPVLLINRYGPDLISGGGAIF